MHAYWREKPVAKRLIGHTGQRPAIREPHGQAPRRTPDRVAAWHAGLPFTIRMQEKAAFAVLKAACQRPPFRGTLAGCLPPGAPAPPAVKQEIFQRAVGVRKRVQKRRSSSSG